VSISAVVVRVRHQGWQRVTWDTTVYLRVITETMVSISPVVVTVRHQGGQCVTWDTAVYR